MIFRVFHYISFIKYPILLLALFFAYRPIFNEQVEAVAQLNTSLILMGLGLGLDSLKDYTKLNWLDRQVFHRPKAAKVYLIILALIIFSIIILGVTEYFSTTDSKLKELSIGMIVFGIGAIGFLKSGIQAAKDVIDRQNLPESK